MLIEETNDLIRNAIVELINSGWLKTHIGKLILGPNGQAHLNHFLKTEDNELANNFGIKPLQKIGQVIEYDAHIVFIHPDDIDQINKVNSSNQKFIEDLIDKLVKHMKGEQKPEITRTKSQIDSVIDDLLQL